MTARAWPGRWRELKRGPLQGNSPNDRIYVVQLVIIIGEYAPVPYSPLHLRPD